MDSDIRKAPWGRWADRQHSRHCPLMCTWASPRVPAETSCEHGVFQGTGIQQGLWVEALRREEGLITPCKSCKR